jgi:hypothetical protein
MHSAICPFRDSILFLVVLPADFRTVMNSKSKFKGFEDRCSTMRDWEGKKSTKFYSGSGQQV